MLIALVACRAPQPGVVEGPFAVELGSTHVVRLEPDEDHSKLRFTMREQRDALLDLQRYLADGRLDEGRAMGFLIAEADHAPSPASQQVISSARTIAEARSIEQAKLALPGLVAACCGCHPFVLAP